FVCLVRRRKRWFAARRQECPRRRSHPHIMTQKPTDNRMKFPADPVQFLTVAIRAAECEGRNPGLHWWSAEEIGPISQKSSV
ncbi:MAG: hypothetical protein ACKON9_18720, partial [Planctomycetaceae bacterium]